jgi:DNA polymerase I-like protein with 3'-5' exonuclease and polymerase domains
MLSHPPIAQYKGLTIILDQPSRFDSKYLISGNVGDYFDKLLIPFTRANCDIRLLEDTRDLLPNTRCVLLLGQSSLERYKSGASLLTYRGSPFSSSSLGNDSITFLPSIAPQDSFDRKNYENPADETNENSEDKESEKDYQKTARKNFKFWFSADVKKAIRIAREGVRSYPEYRVAYCVGAQELVSKLASFKEGYLVIDIETDRNQNITCFSFLFSQDKTLDPLKTYEVYCVPFKRYDGNLFYNKLDYAHIFRALTVAFRDNTVVGHNLSFDLFVLLFKYLVNTPLSIYDTMVAHHRCHPEVEKSLGHCVSYYTDLPYHKDEGVFDPKTCHQETQLWTYNAKDVWTTWLVFIGQQEEIRRLRAEESVAQACGSIRSLLMEQYEGCLADEAKRQKIISENERRFTQYTRILKLLTGLDLNPRSFHDVSHYLYDIRKLPVIQGKKSKTASSEVKLSKYKTPLGPTGEEILLKLFLKYPFPSFKVILAARGVGKEASALSEIKLWRGDRFTCAYVATGTDTFRLGSRELLGFPASKKHKIPKQKGYGTNMQNWNKHIRECVIAPPGKLLFQIDQAGAEALVVAYLCRNARFRSLFLNKIKPHVYVAMRIAPKHWADKLGLSDIADYLNSPIAELKNLKYWKDLETLIKDSDNESNPQKRFYYIGKTCCHLLNYDAMPQQFQLSALIKSEGALAFTIEQAKYYHKLYREELFPEIGDYHVEIVKQLAINGRILRNLFGYPRVFNGAWDRETFKQAYAFIPQSTVGVITLLAQTEITARLDAKEELLRGCSLWQNGHDSILGCAPEEKIMDVCKTLVPHMMRNLVSQRGEHFQMGVGVGIGKNWSPASEKNPDGIKEIKL